MVQNASRSHHGVVDKPLALYPGVQGSIPGFFSLSDETLSHRPISMTLSNTNTYVHAVLTGF